MNNLIRVLIGMVALLSTAAAQAVHLGDLRVNSALGDNFSAVIPLYAPAADELAGADVAVIADPLLGRQPGIRRILDSMTGELIRDASGAWIAIRSSAAVDEPILAFRVRLANGPRSVTRAYSAIIDPRPEPVAARGRAVPPAAATATPAYGPGSYGPVQPGETLWKIASAIGKGYGASTSSVMTALVDANPQAFIDGDMNRLIAGAVLQIPLALGGAEAAPPRSAEAGSAPAAAVPVATPAATASTAAASTATVRREIDWRKNKPELARRLADMDDKFAALRKRYGGSSAAAASGPRAPRVRPAAATAAEPLPEPLPEPATAAAPRPSTDTTTGTATQAATGATPGPETAGAAAGKTPAPAAAAEAAAAAAEPAPVVQPDSAPAVAAVAPPPPAPAATAPAQSPGVLEILSAVIALIPFKLLGYAALVGLAVWGAARAAGKRLKRSRAVTAERVHHDLETERRDEVARKARQRLELEAEVRRIIDDHEDTKARLKSAGLEELTGTVDSGMTEIDLTITHGRYQRAEGMLKDVIREAPRNTAARLRLAEVYYITERVKDFLAEVRELRDEHRQNISDSDWQKLMRMGKVAAPDDPLFGGLSSVRGADRQA